MLGGGKNHIFWKMKNGEQKKKAHQKDHQNSVKTLYLNKKFTSKLTRAERKRKFLTIFQTSEWIFLQNIQKITKYV